MEGTNPRPEPSGKTTFRPRLGSTREFSKHRNVSIKTAQVLAKGRAIPAVMPNGRWVIDLSAFPPGIPRGRHLSQVMQRALLARLANDGRRPDIRSLDKRTRYRVTGYYDRLVASDNPAMLLRGWFVGLAGPQLSSIATERLASFTKQAGVFPLETAFGDLGLSGLPPEVYLSISTRNKGGLQQWNGVDELPHDRSPLLLRAPIEDGKFRLPTVGLAAVHLSRYRGDRVEKAVLSLVARMASGQRSQMVPLSVLPKDQLPRDLRAL